MGFVTDGPGVFMKPHHMTVCDLVTKGGDRVDCGFFTDDMVTTHTRSGETLKVESATRRINTFSA